MPRSRWLFCGSSATSHCSCVAIGACRTKWSAGAPATAGSKASTTDTWGWYSSATSTTSLPATANRFSRPGAGGVFSKATGNVPFAPRPGTETWTAFSSSATRSDVSPSKSAMFESRPR